MSVSAALVIGIAIGLMVGGVVTLLLLRAQHRSLLSAQQAIAEATAAGLRDQLTAEKDHYAQLLAAQAAADEAAQQQKTADSQVLQALAPVRETISEMKTKVADLERQRVEQYGRITAALRTAADSEQQLRTTTETLASALRANNTRGVWGEVQLKSVVEAAGLIERVDFDRQSTITSDAGSGRPDMVVHLPGGKSIAVDAKAPFNAFLEASAIPATATGSDGALRDGLLRKHVKAVRDHVNALGDKRYWDGLDTSPELVIAFIPSESLVSAAMEADPALMEYAFSRRVALASPVTLWSVLKTIAFTWQQDALTTDAKKLFDLGRRLYNRLATMTEHIDKLGRTITTSVKDYNKFVGSLERQVLPSARQLTSMDEAKIIGELGVVEETPRILTAPELTGPDLPTSDSPPSHSPED